MPIRLTFPNKSHVAEDLKSLYEKFKRVSPDLFAIWRDHALRSSIKDYELPAEVSRAAIEFLRNNCEYDSESALALGSYDFEILLYREIHKTDDIDSRKKSLRLTYPIKSHETDDLRSLYEDFKHLNPEIMERWRELSLDHGNDDPELYIHISNAVRKFLRARVDWESNAALIGGYADFGRLLYREIHHKE